MRNALKNMGFGFIGAFVFVAVLGATTVTNYPYNMPPYSITEWVGESIKFVHYDATGVRTEVGQVDKNGRLICQSQEIDNVVLTYANGNLHAQRKDNVEMNITMNPSVSLGKATLVETVQATTVVQTGGGSLFAAGEDGTPLHITYIKAGNTYIQKIAVATDAELAEIQTPTGKGLARDKFKPRKP